MAGLSIYAATKRAVEALTRSWAVELGPVGVLVNAIAPGPTDTEGAAKMPIPTGQILGIDGLGVS